jgi:hypothetical protein
LWGVIGLNVFLRNWRVEQGVGDNAGPAVGALCAFRLSISRRASGPLCNPIVLKSFVVAIFKAHSFVK